MSVVGFDFGNESCIVAVARQRGIDVVLNDESKRETPAIVCFGEKQRFIGTAGAASSIMNPKNAISQIKRLIGRLFSDPELQRDLQSMPFSVSEGPDGYPLIHARYLGEARVFTSTQVLGMLLSNLKTIAGNNLNAAVVDCCIGIPVYFTDLQRRAVLDAATIAGLHPLRLLHETTATALAYGIYKTDLPENDQLNVAFVDVGHSSMQVCIAGFKKGQLKILAHAFDRSLGGRDFDEVLFRYFAAKFKEEYKIDVYQNARACHRLRVACEKLKKVLSANPVAPLNIECLMDEKDVRGVIKRDEFEQISSPILERVKGPLDRALAEAGISVENVHSVEVVGSGSRVPAIIKILTEFFGKEPRRTMNASECVARGCALECAILSPTFKVREFQVNESFPFPIGFSWKGSGPESQNGIEDHQQCTIVFPKGNPIPSVKVVTIYRSSTFSVDVHYADVSELQVPTKISTYVIGPFQAAMQTESKSKAETMEAKPYPETVIEENGQHENHKNNDHGWQTVTYPKRQRKSQPSKQSADRDPVKSRLDSDRDRSSVFRSLEQHAEERIRLRSVHESEKAAAEAAARSKPSAAAASDDDGGDSDAEEAGDAGNKTEAKKPKQKKPKKPKISVAEAAAKIDASDLSAFLIDISTSYEDKQDIQLMRFADYFARAFSSVSASQFPWTKTIKESSVAKISDMPLSYISEPVYKTSVEWISKRSAEALGEFLLWSLDGILADLASQQSIAKSSKKSVQHVPSKAQVAMFVVLAMVLRQKPDVLISQLPKLRDDPKYQGQDKLPVYVWVICQACVGDLVVGMYSWVRNLLPVVSGKSCNPHSRDLVLQLVERILAAPKARPILFNGIVRKGERLVPPTSLELLIHVTFPPPSSRIKATERFEAVYPTLKELSLAGSPGTKAIKQVSHQLLPIAVKAMSANNPELSKEAASIFIWCLSQNTDCYKQWEKLHMENIEASVTVLQMLAGQWKELQIKLTPHDNMKVTLKNLRQKNEQALAGGTNVNHETSFRDADKYCEIILGRLTRRSGCMKSGIIVLMLTIAAGAILMSPNMESWDWKNLHLMFSSSVLNIK